jgi:hypothetical protein
MMAHTNHQADPGRRVILLLGSPRSGTSWLAKILDTQAGVFYAHEPLNKSRAPRVRAFADRLRAGTLDRAGREQLVADICEAEPRCLLPPFFPKAYLGRSPALLRVARAAAAVSGWGRRAFRSCFSPPRHAPFDLLVKEVDWQGHVARLVNGLGPESLVIIVRHPCAVVSSRLQGLRLGLMEAHRAGWLERHRGRCEELGFPVAVVEKMETYEFFALTWLLQNTEYREVASAHPRALTVVYEDLCRDPHGRAAALLAALGWQMSDTTTRFINRSTRTGVVNGIKNLVRGRRAYYSVYKDPVRAAMAWRERLTQEQQQRILAITAPFADFPPAAAAREPAGANGWPAERLEEDVCPAAAPGAQ